MWDLAVREGDWDREDSLLTRRRRGAPPDLSDRYVQAAARGDSVTVSALIAEARTADPAIVLQAAGFASVYLHDLATAERFARVVVASPRPALRARAYDLLARLELAAGRWSGARAVLESAERDGADFEVRRAFAAALPFMAVPRADVDADRARILRWDPTAPVMPEAIVGSHELAPQLRFHLLGLLGVRAGDFAAALRYADSLDRAPVPREAAALSHDLAATLRAEVRQQQGDAAGALAALDGVRGEVPLELISLPYYSEEPARYLRAELLQRLGRDADARRWFATAFEGTPNEVVYAAPAALHRAQLAERLGDRREAAEYYARFVRLWNECDPALRPAVDSARRRLAELGER